MRAYWTCAQTHRGEEYRTAAAIEKRGGQYWLPIMRIGKRRKLLFPRYIFWKVRDDWMRVISGVRYVKSLFLQNERPCRIRPAEINYLRSLENDDGVVVLPEQARPGQRVCVDHRFEGVYIGDDEDYRSRVIVRMFERDVTVVVDAKDLRLL